MEKRRLTIDKYTVGWVCALPLELAAATHLGCIGYHNVVIASLPAGQIGTSSAAMVAVQMRWTFASLRFCLMVGIGGGVPGGKSDVRLGDVVISQPQTGHGGIVQHDFGKAVAGGAFIRTGALNAPPTVLLHALAKLQANRLRHKSDLSPHLSAFSNLPKFSYDNAGPDILFEPTYNHDNSQETCDRCMADRIVKRTPRRSQDIIVHYGTIASGNQVIKDGATRDRVSSELGGVLCFEMEAAGLMNYFPCLVVRGICDYADSHKNKRWQHYAAAVAAACAKEILLIVPAAEVAEAKTIQRLIESVPDVDPRDMLPPIDPDAFNPAVRQYEASPKPRSREASQAHGKRSTSTGNIGIVNAKPHTQLAVISRGNGAEIRIYYTTNENTIHEQCYYKGSGWSPGTLNNHKIAVSAGSRLAVVSWPTGIRIYYQSPNQKICEYVCADDRRTWTKGKSLCDALEGSSLAAAGWASSRGICIHVYYQDKELELRELIWDESWKDGKPHTNLPAQTPPACPRYPNSANTRAHRPANYGEPRSHPRTGTWSKYAKKIPNLAPVREDTGLTAVEWNHWRHKRIYFIKEGLDVVEEYVEEYWSGGNGLQLR